MPPDPSDITYRHIEAALHLAKCAEVVVDQAVVEMSGRTFYLLALVEKEDVVALREALTCLRAVWHLEEED